MRFKAEGARSEDGEEADLEAKNLEPRVGVEPMAYSDST